MNPSASRTARARNLILTAMLAGLLSSCAVAPGTGDEEASAPETAAAASAKPAAVEDDEAGETAEAVDPEVVHSTELNVGDCILDETTGEEIGDVDLVPCDQPHTAEVFAAYDMDPGAYPGEEAVTAAGEEFCANELTGYIGENFESPTAPDLSDISIAYMTPTPESWNFGGDREILCYLTTSSGATTTGSLRGALN